jgi:hypothetical protein
MHPLATVLLSDCTTLTGSGAFVGTGAESFKAKIVNEQKVKKKKRPIKQQSFRKAWRTKD